MCGIFGLYNPTNKFTSDDILKKALKSISHRGPDHTGTYVNKYNENANNGGMRKKVITKIFFNIFFL